ncbi:hypothetical protein [Rhizobium leguminosarum]|uniref:hypothetical protein n=1 Tax=Rhizobium leguminosarum TaxID=384 RepID=UPI00144259F8|nr:hypothetical protein [Rhizobium leguminosarum]NKJ77742.1 hypothetical protein [Rhizobium leguminosarum bv. viciae]
MKTPSNFVLALAGILALNVPLVALNAVTWAALTLVGHGDLWTLPTALAASLTYIEIRFIRTLLQAYRSSAAVRDAFLKSINKAPPKPDLDEDIDPFKLAGPEDRL